jgi:hypothetical protein
VRHGKRIFDRDNYLLADCCCPDIPLVDRRIAAEFIVRAVNAHDDLLAALERFMQQKHEFFNDGDNKDHCIYCQAVVPWNGQANHSDSCPYVLGKAALLKARDEI